MHRLDQSSAREGFPLHQTDAASAWDRQLDAEVEPSASSADGDVGEIARLGTWIHIHARPRAFTRSMVVVIGSPWSAQTLAT